jgi:hypothetical protein
MQPFTRGSGTTFEVLGAEIWMRLNAHKLTRGNDVPGTKVLSPQTLFRCGALTESGKFVDRRKFAQVRPRQ